MFSRTLLLVSLIASAPATAISELAFPKQTELKMLSHQGEDGLWRRLSELEGGADNMLVEPGKYRYAVELPDAYGLIRGEFEAADKQSLYLHKGISDNRKRLFTWVSAAKPRSKAYETERLEQQCRTIRNIGFEDYMLSSCRTLASEENGVGLWGMAKAHKEGLGVEVDEKKASALYKQAWQKGQLNAAVDLYYLDVDHPDARAVIQDAAEQGNLWAQGAYANELAFGKKVDQAAARVFALSAAQQGNLDGLMTMASIEFHSSTEGGSLVDAAAWFRLQRFSATKTSIVHRRLERNISNALYDEDEPAIMARAKVLEKAHFQASPKLYLAVQSLLSFQTNGQIKLVFNNEYQLVIDPEINTYAISMIEPYIEHNLDLEVAGDYESNLRFKPMEVGASEMCLYYEEEESDFKLVPMSQSQLCQSNKSVSMWDHLQEYSF